MKALGVLVLGIMLLNANIRAMNLEEGHGDSPEQKGPDDVSKRSDDLAVAEFLNAGSSSVAHERNVDDKLDAVLRPLGIIELRMRDEILRRLRPVRAVTIESHAQANVAVSIDADLSVRIVIEALDSIAADHRRVAENNQNELDNQQKQSRQAFRQRDNSRRAALASLGGAIVLAVGNILQILGWPKW